MHLHGLTKPPVKADLPIYINMLGVPGQYKSSFNVRPCHKLNFSCCASKDGFHRVTYVTGPENTTLIYKI